MAITSAQIRQQLDNRHDELQMESAELGAALIKEYFKFFLQAGMSPVVAEKAAERLATDAVKSQAQGAVPVSRMAQPESKEREEKYASEAQQQAQTHPSPARGLFGYDGAPPRQAALDPAQLAAYTLANNPEFLQNPDRLLKRAEMESTYATQGFPENRTDYMNPYTTDVVNRIRDEGLRTFREGIMPALEAKFVRMGQHGGSRHAELANRAARDLQSEIMKQQGQALHAGYGQGAQIFSSDQARRMGHSQNLKGLGLAGQASNLANIGALTEAGRMRQGHEQQRKDIGWQDWIRQREEPWLRLAQQSALVKGMHMPMMQDTYSYKPPEPQLNSWGQGASVAGQLLGGLMQQPKGRKSGGRITLNLGRR